MGGDAVIFRGFEQKWIRTSKGEKQRSRDGVGSAQDPQRQQPGERVDDNVQAEQVVATPANSE